MVSRLRVLARLFLFASRDFWFEVPLPFFLRSPPCAGLGAAACAADGDCAGGARCALDNATLGALDPFKRALDPAAHDGATRRELLSDVDVVRADRHQLVVQNEDAVAQPEDGRARAPAVAPSTRARGGQ